jgi:hypothetical protein
VPPPDHSVAEQEQIRELWKSCFGDGHSLDNGLTRAAESPLHDVPLDYATLTGMKAELEEMLANGKIVNFD